MSRLEIALLVLSVLADAATLTGLALYFHDRLKR
jgi:hypothetical protein